MSYRLPGPLREQYSTQGQFGNNPATNPLPPPSNMPISCWFGGKQSIKFREVAIAGFPFVTTYEWKSPIYDLHPELRGISGASSNGRNPSSAVPIWGSGGKALHIQLLGLDANAKSRETVGLIAQEYGHITDPGQVSTSEIAEKADITSQISGNTNSAILHFAPAGKAGSYTRYWQLRLVFGQFEVSAGGFYPEYTIEGAFY